jgi:hypothetical protein
MLAVIELNDSASSPSWSCESDDDLVREVAAAHLLGAFEELVHRAGDRPGQHEAHEKRHREDDQEEHRDDGQDEEQQLRDAVLGDPAGRRRQVTVDLAQHQVEPDQQLLGRPVSHAV